MKTGKEFDYIIVGQGLAGSVLSLELEARGKSVAVVNEEKEMSSSKVAGGLFNPVTGKKMQVTWKAKSLFTYLFDFYIRAEARLGAKFFFPKPMYRPFRKVEDKNEWMGYSANEEVQFFVKDIYDKSLFTGEILNDPLGGIMLNHSGYLDVHSFLKAVKSYLQGKGSYIEAHFDADKLQLEKNLVIYKDIRAKSLIFCDGTDASDNLYFDWLPFAPVKGEVLYIKPEHTLDMIINRGVFMIPISDTICKVGSTYEWNELDHIPTEKGRLDLTSRLEGLYNGKYEILKHIAGVRPATKDRKPFIGMHPEYKTIGIFNGLGTKGVSLAPYLADHFCDCLELGSPLLPEVNIERYFSFYKN